jgi:hypothetical protein
MIENNTNSDWRKSLYPGLYVDVSNSENIWKVARIIDDTDLLTVKYDGW